MNVQVRDYFHDIIENDFPNINNYGILFDLILYGLLGYYYYVGNADLYQILVKFVVIILIIRFLLSSFTDYQVELKNKACEPVTQTKASDQKYKRYFQINFYLAIFMITIMIMIKTNKLNNYLGIFLIAVYALGCSAVGYNFTVDNMFTILTVFVLFNININFLKMPSPPPKVAYIVSPSSIKSSPSR